MPRKRRRLAREDHALEEPDSHPGASEAILPPAVQPHTDSKPRKTSSRRPKAPLSASPFFSEIAAASPSKRAVSTVYGPGLPSEVETIHHLPRCENFFGLIQELLVRDIAAPTEGPAGPGEASCRRDPLVMILHMLIATCLLNQTRGRQAVPLFWQLIVRWPTAEALRDADLTELTDFLQPIGLHRRRAQRLVDLGTVFSESPPRAGVLYDTRGQKTAPPRRSSCGVYEVAENVATCIGHLPGVGKYAVDSFRIFCVGGGAQRSLGKRPPADKMEAAFAAMRSWRPGAPQRRAEEVLVSSSPTRKPQQPQKVSDMEHLALLQHGGCDVLGQSTELEEWQRVLPLDKELRAYLQWRWAKLGILWDPVTGPVGPLPEAM